MKSELQEIEMTIDEAREQINRREALDRLRKNKDFQLIIEEGYLKDEGSRLVLAKAEPTLADDANQKQVDNMIIGVGYFRQYLNKIYQFGNQAEMAMKSHEETRSELMAEEA